MATGEKKGGRGEGDALIFTNCCSFKKGAVGGIGRKREREREVTYHMAIDLKLLIIIRNLSHATNQLFYNWLVNIHPPGHGPDLLSKQLSVFFVR